MNDSLVSADSEYGMPEELYRLLIRERVDTKRYSTGTLIDDVARRIEWLYYNDKGYLDRLIKMRGDEGVYQYLREMMIRRKDRGYVLGWEDD